MESGELGMNYYCSACKIESTSPTGWLDHLRSEAHQFIKREEKTTQGIRGWDPSRTLFLNKVRGIPSRNILEYLFGWGHVTDFSYLSKKDGFVNECYALFSSSEVVDKILQFTAPHVLNGKTIDIRRRTQRIPPTATNTRPTPLRSNAPPSLDTKGSDFYCKGCEGRYVGKSLQAWLAHLRSEDHQGRHQKTQHLRKTSWDLERKVMINRVKGIPKIKILEYISSWGPIEDFSYLCKRDGGINVCYALFANQDTVNRIVETTRHRLPDGKNIAITLIKPEEKVKWGKFRDKLESKASSSAPSDTLPEHQDRPRKSDYDCLSCNFEAKCVEEWVDHLCSIQHRKAKSNEIGSGFRTWSSKNGIRLNKVLGLPKKEILQWGLVWGSILDFIYQNDKDGAADFCHILFSSHEVAQKILTSQGLLVIGKTPVLASPLPEFPGWRKARRKLLAEQTSQQVQSLPKPASVGLDKLANRLKGLKLENQIDEFMMGVGWTPEFLKRSEDMINEDFKVLLSKASIKTTAQPFGSIVTKTGLKNQLLVQVLLDVQELGFKEEQGGQSQNIQLLKSVVHTLQVRLRNVTQSCNLAPGRIWINSFALPDGSTAPEVCFSDLGRQSDVSIRFGNVLAVQESKLIKLYSQLDRRVLPVLLILVYWSELHEAITVPEELFQNQVLLLLIIFFLQHKKVVPTVEQLQNFDSCPKLINGFNVSFCSDLNILNHKEMSMLQDPSICALSTLSLVKEFFEFYGSSVDLSETVLCTRIGNVFPKSYFSPENVGSLPGNLARMYRYGVDGQPRSRILPNGTPVCIQDPFDLTLNLTKSLTNLDKFKLHCRQTAAVLEQLSMEEPSLMEIFSQSNTGSNPTDPKNNLDPDSSGISPAKLIKLDDNIDEDGTDGKDDKKEEWDSWYTSESKVLASTSSAHVSNNEVPKLSTLNASHLQPQKNLEANEDVETEDWDDREKQEIGEEDEDNEEDNNTNCVEGDGDDDSNVVFDLNGPLFQYFERSFKEDDELKWKKLQTLALQYILEFNSIFFTNCLGLVFEPKKGQKFWLSDWAKTGEAGCLTLQERLDQINLDEKTINLKFRVRSGNSVHNVLCGPPETLVIKRLLKGPILSQLNVLLRNEAEAGPLKKSEFQPSNPDNYLEFEANLTGSCVPVLLKTASIARLKITGVASQIMQLKMRVLKKLLRKLGQSYVNRMVKQWLDSCKDFNREKADNFSISQHQRWNKKTNKRKKQNEKQMAKKAFRGSAPGRGGTQQKGLQGSRAHPPAVRNFATTLVGSQPQGTVAAGRGHSLLGMPPQGFGNNRPIREFQGPSGSAGNSYSYESSTTGTKPWIFNNDPTQSSSSGGYSAQKQAAFPSYGPNSWSSPTEESGYQRQRMPVARQSYGQNPGGLQANSMYSQSGGRQGPQSYETINQGSYVGMYDEPRQQIPPYADYSDSSEIRGADAYMDEFSDDQINDRVPIYRQF